MALRNAARRLSRLQIAYLVYCMVFLILGGLLFFISIWLRAEQGDFALFYERLSFYTISWIGIAVGILITIFSVFGIIGGFRGNRSMVLVFFVLIGITFLLEVGAAVVGGLYWQELPQYLHYSIQTAMNNYDSPNQRLTMRGLDEVHKWFHCCGTDSYVDWARTNFYKQRGQVPDSCCLNEYRQNKCGSRVGFIFHRGCFAPLMEASKSHTIVVLVVVTICAIVQIFGIVTTLMFMVRMEGNPIPTLARRKGRRLVNE